MLGGFLFPRSVERFFVLGGLALLYLGRSSAPGTGTSFFSTLRFAWSSFDETKRPQAALIIYVRDP